MADMETYRVFLIENGTALQIVNDYLQAKKQRRDELLRLLGEFGDPQIYDGSGFFAGLKADKNPDEKIFKRHKRHSQLWEPRLNTKKGKELAKAIENASKGAVRHNINHKFVTKGNIMYARERTDGGFGMWMVSPQFFGSDPYFFLLPKEAENVELVDGLRELKLSEYYQMVEQRQQLAKTA